MNSLYQQFEQLGKKQSAYADGIAMIQQAQSDFGLAKAAANVIGAAAIGLNAALIVGNIILNACDLKVAVSAATTAASTLQKSIYQLSYSLYNKHAASGTRMDEGLAKKSLEILKKEATDRLVKKGLGQYVPGVNILVGLAQDSIALVEVAKMVNDGNREMNDMASRIERNLAQMQHQLMVLGARREEIFEQLQLSGIRNIA